MSSNYALEIGQKERFAFGENWSRFLACVDESRISRAESSLREMLEVQTLADKTFLDIGSGSGLFSLAARRLGARVNSFDYDAQCVACTEALKARYFPDDAAWVVEQGSILDVPFTQSLQRADIVYSWGVLHHTGAMWRALANAAELVAPGGRLFIAIYNDQGWRSRVWLRVKQMYNRLPMALRWIVLGPALARLWGPTVIRDLARGRPFSTWREYEAGSMRGMSPWRDVVDWVGGLPFEVATPDSIRDFYSKRGLALLKLRTCGGGLGCNEFVFAAPHPSRGGA